MFRDGPDKPRVVQKPTGAELEDSLTLPCSADFLPEVAFFPTFKKKTMCENVHFIEEMEEEHLEK